MNIKKRHIVLGIFAILNIFWNIFIVAEGKGVDFIVVLNIIGDLAFAFALMDLFAAIIKAKPVTNESPQMIGFLILGITKLIVIYLEEGSLLRTTAFLHGGVVLIALLTLTGVIKSTSPMKMTNDEVFKFGYWWVAGVLLIPVILILTFVGF